MSRKGLKVALEYGKKLLGFSNLKESEKYFMNYKDNMLSQLQNISDTRGEVYSFIDYNIYKFTGKQIRA